MSKRLKILTSAFFIAAALLLVGKPTHASEGTAEVISTTGRARCLATSVLMQNRRYKVVVSCRDLIYPPTPDLLTYMVWATPVGGGNPERLGELGVGKAEFTTNTAFSDLLVTTETDNRVRSPSDRVVMRGNIQPVSFLESAVEAAQAPPAEREEPAEEFGEMIEEPTPTPTPTPEQPRVLSGLQRAGIIFIIVVFVLILIIAAITRARG